MKFTKIQAQFLASRVLCEGSFQYAMIAYSSYPAIKSPVFRKLFNAYNKKQSKTNYEKLKNYILKTAGLKSFRQKAVNDNWKSFSDELVRLEEFRWSIAIKKDLLELYKSIPGLEPGGGNEEACAHIEESLKPLEELLVRLSPTK